MNKEGFNQLVTDYTKVDQNFQELEKMVVKYPYSQPLRLLNLQSSAKRSKEEYQRKLGLAAFYATDRNVLRSLVEEGKVPSDLLRPTQTKKPKAKSTLTITSSKEKKPDQPTAAVKGIDIDQLRKEVLTNLAELQQHKSQFLELTAEGEMEITVPSTSQQAKSTSALKKKKAKPTKKTTTSEKSIRQRLKAKPKATRSRTKKDDIIDKFIADKPSITPNQRPKENQSDLSKPSSVLKEDLVSENLAIIFANQGKTAKAIEIYKKLIWKFPQKKASFAARIEELKQK